MIRIGLHFHFRSARNAPANSAAPAQRIPEAVAAVVAAINSPQNYILPVTQQDRMLCDGYG